MIYENGIPLSLQLFEDGELIKDTHHIITAITLATNLPLKDKDGKIDRKLSGFVLNDDEIMNGSYAIHSYSYGPFKYR